MILESSVGHREGCVWGGAGQGEKQIVDPVNRRSCSNTTRNSLSIARSCNAAMRRRKRAIRGVALLTQKVKSFNNDQADVFIAVSQVRSGQLGILG